MSSAWERIGDSDMGPIKQGLLGEYQNIKALLEEMPASNEPESKKLVSKAEGVLRKGFGINKDTAVPLNEALADPEMRAALIKISKEDPEALSKAMDQIKENPAEAKTILAGVITLPDRAEPPSHSAGSPAATPPSNKPSAIGEFFDKIAQFFSEKFEAIVVAVKDIFNSKERTPGINGNPTESPILTTVDNDRLSLNSIPEHTKDKLAALATSLKDMGVTATPPNISNITAGYKAKGSGSIEV